MSEFDYDFVIVGAGLSGIGAASILARRCPKLRVTLLEAREELGGTWSLFNYPGIRCDSTMVTYGYYFKPYTGVDNLPSGKEINDYIRDTALEYGIFDKIQYNTKVERASFSSENASWTIHAKNTKSSATETIKAHFLYCCGGYYSYDHPFMPEFPGVKNFRGQLVHSQFFHEYGEGGINYAGKNVVIIGSGATAVTLLPTLAQRAEHVTQIQRTPTFIWSCSTIRTLPTSPRPSQDDFFLSSPKSPNGGSTSVAKTLAKIFKGGFRGFFKRVRQAYDEITDAFMSTYFYQSTTYRLERYLVAARQAAIYYMAVTFPLYVRNMFLTRAKQELGSFYTDKDWAPPYNPWEQRLCASPDGDFFAAVRRGAASIVTGQIETFTEDGIKVRDRDEVIPAEVVIAATGMNMVLCGGMTFEVDGKPWWPEARHDEAPDSKTAPMLYKGALLTGLPNFIYAFGYVTSSWTLKADLIAEYACRLINYMDKKKKRTFYVSRDPKEPVHLLLEEFSGGYMRRGQHTFPRKGEHSAWNFKQSYYFDYFRLIWGSINDGIIKFA